MRDESMKCVFYGSEKLIENASGVWYNEERSIVKNSRISVNGSMEMSGGSTKESQGGREWRIRWRESLR